MGSWGGKWEGRVKGQRKARVLWRADCVRGELAKKNRRQRGLHENGVLLKINFGKRLR